MRPFWVIAVFVGGIFIITSGIAQGVIDTLGMAVASPGGTQYGSGPAPAPYPPGVQY